jgi:hypothetical protein
LKTIGSTISYEANSIKGVDIDFGYLYNDFMSHEAIKKEVNSMSITGIELQAGTSSSKNN